MLLFVITCLFIPLSIYVRSQTAQEKKKNPTCAVFPKNQHVQFGSEVHVTCQSSCRKGKIYWEVNGQLVADRFSQSINSSHTVLSLKNFTYKSAIIQCHSVLTDLVLDGTNIKTYSKINYIYLFVFYSRIVIDKWMTLFDIYFHLYSKTQQRIMYFTS